MFVKIISLLFGRELLLKRLNMQRRLEWSMCKYDTHTRIEANPFLTSTLNIYNFHSAHIFCLLTSHTMMSDILAEHQPLCWKRKGNNMQAISPCWYSSSNRLHELFIISLDNFGTKYFRIPSALTDRVLICPSPNITPPVSLCSSNDIVDIPVNPI